MPRKHAFGATAWGRYFVEALEGQADEGRLARGRSYAGNERVAALEIESGLAQARVRGNYRPFYEVRIAFPPLSRAESRALAAILESDPLMIERIRSGDFPPELLERIRGAGIDLFPKRWSEMRRGCDCPDSGDPCKHEAAVYYLLAQEIDRDPSLLFTLRGVELETMGPRGGEPPPEEASPGLATAVDPLPLRWVEAWDEEDAGSFPAEMPPIASYAALLPRILPPGPALAGLELPTALAGFYHFLAREWERPFEASRLRGRRRGRADAADEVAQRRLATSESRVVIRGSSCVCLVEARELGLLEAVRLVLACDQAQGTRSFEFLRRFSLAMRAIVAAGAIHPVSCPGPGPLRAIWTPASFGEDVRGALDWVAAAALPPEVKRAPPPDRPGRRGRPPKAARPALLPDRRSLVEALAASFLGDYVRELGYEPAGSIAAASPVSRTLFALEASPCGSPSLRSLPRALAVYRLALGRGGLELVAKGARRGGEAQAAYRLSASLVDPEGSRLPLHKAAAASGRGRESLAFPALLSNFVPGLAALGAAPSVILSEEELSRLVVEAAPLLARLGVSVVLPKELAILARPKPILAAKRRAAASLASVLDIGSAFSFEWKVALGGALVDPAEFAAMVRKGSALFRFRGSFVRLDPEEAASILERIKREKRPEALGAVKAVLAGEAEPEGELASSVEAFLGKGGGKGGGGRARRAPAGLEARLRPYQERGFRWIMANLERGLGCLLADDMGLGKTVQAIAAMLALKEEGRLGSGCIVVAPASLLANWERELERFAPSLSVRSHYGPKRRLGAADVLLTTYDTLLRDLRSLGEADWDLAVLDEAHLAKNPDAKRSRAVKALRASRRLALTGTPVENNLSELWSVLDFALPGYLGGLGAFAREFRRPIEVERSAEAAARLRRITSPFVLRRLKTDREIAPDLPDKLVIQEYASLTTEQVALYRAAAEEGLAAIDAAEGIERRGLVLALITALKQISNHPRNWDKESPPAPERSGKARLLLALLESAMEAGERVLVFSQYVEMLKILEPALRAGLGVEPYLLHGGMGLAAREEAVRRFQAETGPGVFLISLKAGGLGLNLTAATRVFHYDLWFNPAVEEQATDRAFRIGQQRDVFVHRLVTRGTLEERIAAALQSKRELAELTVGAGETWLTELSTAELRDLLELASGP
ncbi:MAG TPA: SNF2-related protein [Spirochaetales bacterium]|nr:SNF2-related protein [Spirochaetales bacterium]